MSINFRMFKSYPQSSVEFSDEENKVMEIIEERNNIMAIDLQSRTAEQNKELKEYMNKLDERTIPEINLLSLIAPLPKPDKDPSKAGSYRPVSLTEVFIRVMEKTLKIKMVEHVECLRLFGAGQHGFRKKHSTTSNILHPHERIIKQLEDYGRDHDIILHISSEEN